MTARAIQDGVRELVGRYNRMTVRQSYYQLATWGVVEKSENPGYRQVQREVLRMRREGLLPWSFITDGTRWQRRPATWDCVDDAVGQMARSYRRNLWADQKARIEIWLEKDALADVIFDATAPWDVPLMVSRGQSSTSFLWSAAQEAARAWERAGVETFLYALYDRDAGGRRAARTPRRAYTRRGDMARHTGWSPNRNRAAQARFRQQVLARDKYRCCDCGAAQGPQAAHLVPLSEGGGYHVDEGITLCAPCHKERDQYVG